MKNHGKFVCPYCASDEVIPIIYGLPSPATEENARKGEFILGGCVVEEGSPNLYCKSCDHNWYDKSARQW
jgi:hypothetical protein